MNRENQKFYMLAFLSFLCMVAIAVTPFPVYAAELPEEPATSESTPEESSSAPEESSVPEENSSVPEENSSAPEESSVPEENSSVPEESSSAPEESSSAPEEIPLEPPEILPPTIEEQTLSHLSAMRQNSDVFLYLVVPIAAAVLLIYRFCVWFYRAFVKTAL